MSWYFSLQGAAFMMVRHFNKIVSCMYIKYFDIYLFVNKNKNNVYKYKTWSVYQRHYWKLVLLDGIPVCCALGICADKKGNCIFDSVNAVMLVISISTV